MRDFRLLNRKEIKKINETLKEQFGNEFDFSNYVVYRTVKDRLHIVNKEIAEIDLAKLRVNNLGLYFLTFEKNGVRLSIDGSQMYKASKNVLELNKKQFDLWMLGIDLPIQIEKGFYILKYKDHYLGCGYCNGEKIPNYVPKERRVKFE